MSGKPIKPSWASLISKSSNQHLDTTLKVVLSQCSDNSNVKCNVQTQNDDNTRNDMDDQKDNNNSDIADIDNINSNSQTVTLSNDQNNKSNNIQDIDIMDIDYNDQDDEIEINDNVDIDDDNLDNYRSFLSLTIGERVLLLHIIIMILPHQSGYNLLKCFRIYHKIFGIQLYNKCKSSNNIWFWKSLYLRDFGKLIFKQQNNRKKRNKKSSAQQLIEYEWNKKESSLFWKNNYINEYKNTKLIVHNISYKLINKKIINKKGKIIIKKQKQKIETISYDSYAIHKHRSWNNRHWLYNQAVVVIAVLSQHKLPKINKLLEINNFCRCNWFLEIEHYGTQSKVKKLTKKYHFNADKFRGYINRFDVRMIKLFIKEIRKIIDNKKNKKNNKQKTFNSTKVETFSDIKDDERILLISVDDMNIERKTIFGFKRMIGYKTLIRKFYERSHQNRLVTINVLYFERCHQGIVVKYQ